MAVFISRACAIGFGFFPAGAGGAFAPGARVGGGDRFTGAFAALAPAGGFRVLFPAGGRFDAADGLRLPAHFLFFFLRFLMMVPENRK